METIRIGEFQNFNQIIELYLETMKMLSDPNSNKFKQKKLDRFSNKEYIFSYITMSLMNEISKIEEIYEKLNYSEEERKKVFFDKKDIPPFFEIKVDGVEENDRSLDALLKKFKQIRNCIAHSNYYLELENKKDDDVESNVNIVFDDSSKKVEGKISFYDFSRVHGLLSYFFKNKTTIPYYSVKLNADGITVKDPNKFLAECLRKMSLIDSSSRKERSLTDEEKKRIKTFSLMMGPKEMKSYLLRYSSALNRPIEHKELLFASNFNELIEKIIKPEESVLNTQDLADYDMFLGTLYKYHGLNLEDPFLTKLMSPSEIEDNKNRETYKWHFFNSLFSNVTLGKMREWQLEKFFMNRPFLYKEGLLCMTNYIVGYIREKNINYGRTFFKFTDIDLSGVKIDIEDPEEPSITVTNLGEKKLKEIDQLKIQMEARQRLINLLIEKNISDKGNLISLSKIADSKGIDKSDGFITKMSELRLFLTSLEKKSIDELDIQEVEKTLEEYAKFINTSDKSKLPYPGAILNNITGILQQLGPLYREVESFDKRIAKEKLEYDRVKGEPSFTDTSGFFGHLRNAIVHSNVKVDYSKAAKSRKIEDIEYTFVDHKTGCPSWITFKATISGKDLIKIMQKVQASINKQVEESDKNKLFENKYLRSGILDEEIDQDDLQTQKKKEDKEEDRNKWE